MKADGNSARILLIGTATLDLVFAVDHHPAPDEEMRAASLRTCRGGNAANTAVVLASLGHRPEFFGVLAEAAESAVITQDFSRAGVNFGRCPCLPGRPPTSSIYLSGGNRSIVHYRDLPELTFAQFAAHDWRGLDWVHCEGRNVAELQNILVWLREQLPGVPLSIELEKPRPGIEVLYGLADWLICSRGFALAHGDVEPGDFLRELSSRAPQAHCVVAWGEGGAYGLAAGGEVMHVLSEAVATVVDTLGAGDTFNAGLLDALARGATMQPAMTAACRLAARKCAQAGFEGLR